MQFSSLAEILMPITGRRQGAQADLDSNTVTPKHSDVLEADVMSIDTYTSREEREIRSIRGHDSHHDHRETAEERAFGEIERFRTFALEQLENTLEDVLHEIVEDVLGREMQLAPVDLAQLVQRALRKFERQGPVRLRVSPADVARVQTELPIVADFDLAEGDLVIEVRDGEIESRLPVRLACALSRLQSDAVHSVLGEVASTPLHLVTNITHNNG